MLAYLFWHTPHSTASLEAYEDGLRRFHRLLKQQRLSGQLRSCTYKLDSVPWLASTRPVYEDWYVLDSSSALDVLNEAAVAAHARSAHDELAQLSADGNGGLYRFCSGGPNVEAPVAVWFRKPAGMRYDALNNILAKDLSLDTALWQRQMALGPAREFCLVTPHKVDLPLELEPLLIQRLLVAD